MQVSVAICATKERSDGWRSTCKVPRSSRRLRKARCPPEQEAGGRVHQQSIEPTIKEKDIKMSSRNVFEYNKVGLTQS